MSSDYIKSISNFILHLFFLLSLCSLETTIFSSIGFIPHTDLWLVPIVYFSLHREFNSSMLFCFFSCLIVGAFTATPYSSILLGCLLTSCLIYFIKNRSYVEGLPYFMFMALGAVLFFYISLLASSWLLFEDPIASPKVVKWVLSALITPLFAAPLRFIFWVLDTLTNTKQPFGFEVN